MSSGKKNNARKEKIAPHSMTSKKREEKEEALRRALASAFAATPERKGKPVELDHYGASSPSDRLQFGYSPASQGEAVAYHSQFTAQDWIAQRRKNGRLVFVSKKTLSTPNCEPFTSVLKLRNYWNSLSKFTANAREDYIGENTADNILEKQAAKQRLK